MWLLSHVHMLQNLLINSQIQFPEKIAVYELTGNDPNDLNYKLKVYCLTIIITVVQLTITLYFWDRIASQSRWNVVS